jgi:hypothetical protein
LSTNIYAINQIIIMIIIAYKSYYIFETAMPNDENHEKRPGKLADLLTDVVGEGGELGKSKRKDAASWWMRWVFIYKGGRPVVRIHGLAHTSMRRIGHTDRWFLLTGQVEPGRRRICPTPETDAGGVNAGMA